jgi:UDPglucose 6-dehydrogenase
MNIAVVGTGYVGLVTGTCFAETGINVTCVDINADKIRRMNNGEVPIFEPGLENLFERNKKQGRLHFTTSLPDAIKNAKVIFLALPTPPGEDGSADLSYILKVADDLSHLITDYKVIVDKSTVPVGTAEKVHAIIAKRLNPALFDVVSNPEFLREGVAVEDFMKPDRVVIGTSSERAKAIMQDLYAPFVRQGNPVLFMDERSAELTKYAANSYLAMRISFMNEIANLCEVVGADVDKVRMGIGSDNRIGKRFLFAGVGYGGSCFPKDVEALSFTANEYNYDFKILQAVRTVNALQRKLFVEKIFSFFKHNLQGKHIAIWGLAFKPNTDDIREAPALYIIDRLLEAGATITAFDPEAGNHVRSLYNNKITVVEEPNEALKNADALAIVTEWTLFRTPDFELMRKLMAAPVIFDGRNVYDQHKMQGLGFYYESIGREIIHS